MKNIFLFCFLLFSPKVLAASCCTGGTSKTFVTLSELQKYEFGLSTTFKNAYGRYNAYGDLVESEKNQWMTTTLGMAARLSVKFDLFTNLPIVWRRLGTQSDSNRFSLGDWVMGFQYHFIEPTFQDDWYPHVQLHFGIKFPTGAIEKRDNGRVLPGAGNGAWEPFAGVGFEKPIGPAKLGLRFTYSKRLAREGFKEGDLFELSETSNFLLSPQWNLMLGMGQSWETPLTLSGQSLADSQSRVWTAFLSAGYALSQLWNLSGGIEFSLPFDRFGMNQPATQSVTLTTRYALF